MDLALTSRLQSNIAKYYNLFINPNNLVGTGGIEPPEENKDRLGIPVCPLHPHGLEGV